MIERPKYKVVGCGPFGVLDTAGGMEYDLLDTRAEAEEICDVLNAGIGPEWDAVEAEIERRKAGNNEQGQ